MCTKYILIWNSFPLFKAFVGHFKQTFHNLSLFECADNTKGLLPKPRLTLEQANELTLRLYGVTVTEISTLPSYIDQNFLVVDEKGARFVLKIMNADDSKNGTLLEVQTLSMSFLRQHGIPAQTAIPTTTGKLLSMEEIGINIISNFRKLPKC